MCPGNPVVYLIYVIRNTLQALCLLALSVALESEELAIVLFLKGSLNLHTEPQSKFGTYL